MSTRVVTAVVAAVTVLVLVALDVAIVFAHLAQSPYDAYLGPTPAGWWLLALALAGLLAATVALLAGKPRALLTGIVLATLAATAFLLVAAYVRQAAGLEALIAVGALALGVAPLARNRGRSPSRGWTAILVLGCLVALFAVAACGLGLIGRPMRTVTVYAASPDGRYRLVSDYYDPGAMGATNEIVNVRRDYLGLLRREQTVYVPQRDFVARLRWVDDATIAVDGKRIDINAVPPVGW